MADQPCAATPRAELERQIMDWNIPKNEREWWAATEIEALRRENQELRAAVIEECAKVAYSIQPPKSIGRDHGRHHMAGAQAAAKAIRALTMSDIHREQLDRPDRKETP